MTEPEPLSLPDTKQLVQSYVLPPVPRGEITPKILENPSLTATTIISLHSTLTLYRKMFSIYFNIVQQFKFKVSPF